jgi:hypothetical protein
MSEQSTEPAVSSASEKLIPERLHVWTNEEEWYVAKDDADFREQWREMMGDESPDDYDYRQMPDDETITIDVGADGEIADDDGNDPVAKTTRTAGEWAARNGRGLLATTYL